MLTPSNGLVLNFRLLNLLAFYDVTLANLLPSSSGTNGQSVSQPPSQHSTSHQAKPHLDRPLIIRSLVVLSVLILLTLHWCSHSLLMPPQR